jgi:hypothetical protein
VEVLLDFPEKEEMPSLKFFFGSLSQQKDSRDDTVVDVSVQDETSSMCSWTGCGSLHRDRMHQRRPCYVQHPTVIHRVSSFTSAQPRHQEE